MGNWVLYIFIIGQGISPSIPERVHTQEYLTQKDCHSAITAIKHAVKENSKRYTFICVEK